MSKKIADSELILNPNGSVYHLQLLPEQISDTIIFVGDPDRVEKVTQYFDVIEFTIHTREFKTQTGTYKGKRITVISTGIGCDNIDIVINELDALVNVDLKTRMIKEKLTALNIIRIGTSGSLHSHIPINSFLVSTYAIGLYGILFSYESEHIREIDIEDAFVKHTNFSPLKSKPYCIKNDGAFVQKFISDKTFTGITMTANGFYGPQGRTIRLGLQDAGLKDKIQSFEFENQKITNLEMETSAIYGLSKLLGHNAVSMNAILANRVDGTFSKNPAVIVDDLIRYTLDKIIE